MARELQLGEYTLHLFVQDVAALDVGSGNTVEVGLQFNAFGKYSDARSYPNINVDSELYIGEHFFAVKSFTDREVLENEELEVAVLKKGIFNKLTGNTLGAIKINICQIYFEKDRTIHHRWFILQNRDDPSQFQKVKGYVKLSLTLSHSQDPKIELLPESLEDRAKNKTKWDVEIPASISIKTNQIVINLIRGENLPVLDSVGSDIDAYAQFSIGTSQIKSSVVSSTRPTWNQKIMLPVMVPSFVKSLLMQVQDHDLANADDPVGSVQFPLDTIIKGQFREPMWVHLYGAPLDPKDKEQTQFMHQYPDKGMLIT